MKISSILEQRHTTLSFEIFPPKKSISCETVIDTALSLAKLDPDFISVTYGAGGTSQENTLEIAASLQKRGDLPTLAHLTCVGATRDKIEHVMAEMKKRGIENILALRGDLPAGVGNAVTPAFSHASDLVPLLRKNGFCVGGACYPEGHPESGNRLQDLDFLCRKVDAGCEFLTTQMFFDNDMLYSFLYQMQSRGIRVPVLAGIMPVTNANQIKRMLELSNAYMPRKLLRIIDRFRDAPDALRQAGIAYATDQIIDLVSNGIRGIHIYSMNKSDISEAIIRNVSEILDATR